MHSQVLLRGNIMVQFKYGIFVLFCCWHDYRRCRKERDKMNSAAPTNDYRYLFTDCVTTREISIQRDTVTGTIVGLARNELYYVLPTKDKRFQDLYGSGLANRSVRSYRMRNDAALACSSSPVVDSAPPPPRPSWLMSGVKGTSSLVRFRRPA